MCLCGGVLWEILSFGVLRQSHIEWLEMEGALFTTRASLQSISRHSLLSYCLFRNAHGLKVIETR